MPTTLFPLNPGESLNLLLALFGSVLTFLIIYGTTRKVIIGLAPSLTFFSAYLLLNFQITGNPFYYVASAGLVILTFVGGMVYIMVLAVKQ